MSRLRVEMTGAKSAELYIYDAIGDDWMGGVSAKMVASALHQIGKATDLAVRINSEGGSVMDAYAIYRLLVDSTPKITVHVDGLAASAASLIAMAGERIIMSEASYMMIHNPTAAAIGTSSEMRRIADLMDSMAGQVINVYAGRSGQKEDEIAKMMDAETWMTPEQAIDLGFADAVAENYKIAARGDLSLFTNVPEPLQAAHASHYNEDAIRERFEALQRQAESGVLRLRPGTASGAKKPKAASGRV